MWARERLILAGTKDVYWRPRDHTVDTVTAARQNTDVTSCLERAALQTLLTRNCVLSRVSNLVLRCWISRLISSSSSSRSICACRLSSPSSDSRDASDAFGFTGKAILFLSDGVEGVYTGGEGSWVKAGIVVGYVKWCWVQV